MSGNSRFVMPGLVPGIHEHGAEAVIPEDLDCRDRPGNDAIVERTAS